MRHFATLDEAFTTSGRGRYDVLAHDVSPDGQHAVALLRVRETGYLLDAHYVHETEGWTDYSISSGGGQVWSSLGGDAAANVGVLRIAREAPNAAKSALVRWKDNDYEVPVSKGWLYFVRWDAAESDVPPGGDPPFKLVAFR
jgi:hypothetical protein